MAVLVTAGLAGSALAFMSKAACRGAGIWTTPTGIGEYQAHCYTDIYPLYYTEHLTGAPDRFVLQLSAGLRPAPATPWRLAAARNRSPEGHRCGLPSKHRVRLAAAP